MRDCNDIVLSLLTCAIRGEAVSHDLLSSMTDEEIKAVYDLAKKHDLTHLIGVALEKAESEDKNRYKPFFQDEIKAMYRYEWLKGEYIKICSLLQKHAIPYLPLKGSVIRELYREPWHRTSSDIDILIPEERMEDALAALENELSYTRGEHTLQDVSLRAPNGVHFELHFDSGEMFVDCAEIWADARLVSPESYKHALSAEMIILTHIAHMAKHFVNGGCGLRPFLDLWLMREKLSYDKEKLTQMFENHGLTAFSKVMFGLVEVWFDGKASTETEQMAQAFLLPGGVYGNMINGISVTRAGGKNMFLYVVRRVFPHKSVLLAMYPSLRRHSWLLPICHVRRWIRLIFTGKLKKIKTEYDVNRKLDANQLNQTGELLKRLELKKW